MSVHRRREHLLPLILSFAAGFVEAIRFVGLHRTFATFITGTLMILIGTVLEPLTSAHGLNTLVVSVAAVLAMSLHSTVFFVLLKSQAPTHFMTGNLTNFGVVRLYASPDPVGRRTTSANVERAWCSGSRDRRSATGAWRTSRCHFECAFERSPRSA